MDGWKDQSITLVPFNLRRGTIKIHRKAHDSKTFTQKDGEKNKSDKMEQYMINKINNTELNDRRKTICLRKSEVSVERISVCNVIKNVGAWPCSNTNDVIDLFP